MVFKGSQLSGAFLKTSVNFSVTGLPGTAKMPSTASSGAIACHKAGVQCERIACYKART